MQCSELSRGPNGTEGVMPRRREGTGPLAVVLCRENYSGDCRDLHSRPSLVLYSETSGKAVAWADDRGDGRL